MPGTLLNFGIMNGMKWFFLILKHIQTYLTGLARKGITVLICMVASAKRPEREHLNRREPKGTGRGMRKVGL